MVTKTKAKKKVAKKKATKKKVVKKVAKKLTAKERAELVATDMKNYPDKYTFGRPTKYCHSFPKKIYEACVSDEVRTTAGICVMLDIARDTYDQWKKKYPLFSEAIKKGHEFRKKHMEDVGYNGITGGKEFNAVPWLFLTKNMFPEEYSDKKELSIEPKENEKGRRFVFNLVEDPKLLDARGGVDPHAEEGEE